MPEVQQQQAQKVVEKYYIETSPSILKRFFAGFLGGIGWGIGITVGTSVVLLGIGFFVSKVNFVPILGDFLAKVIESAQGNLQK